VPFLEFHQHEQPANESLQLNTSVFDSLTGIDRFSFVLQDFGHAYLTGNLVVVPDLPKKIVQQHEFWYSSIKAFFDAYLKKDENMYENLWNSKSSEPLLFKNERIQAEGE